MATPILKPVLDVGYTNRRCDLQLVADLAGGWFRGAKTYGYVEHTWIDFPCDYVIKAELSVLPEPRGFQMAAHTCPTVSQAQGGDENAAYSIRDSVVTATIRLLEPSPVLNQALNWLLTDKGKLSLTCTWLQIARRHDTEFELGVHLLFNPPPHASPKSVQEWQKRFIPHGLAARCSPGT